MAMGTFAVILAIGMAAWIWLDAPSGPSRVAWIVTASTDVVAFLGVVGVLVFGSQPARLVAQPGWTWIFFGLPWLVMLLALAALVATLQDLRTKHLGERWLARYGLLAVGVGVNLSAMVILGIIPGI